MQSCTDVDTVQTVVDDVDNSTCVNVLGSRMTYVGRNSVAVHVPLEG